MASDGALLAALAIVSSCVAGLIWIIRYMFTKFLPVIVAMKTSLDLNTVATQKNTELVVKVDQHITEVNGSHKEIAQKTIESMSGLEASVHDIPEKLEQIASKSSETGLAAIKIMLEAGDKKDDPPS